MRFNFFHREKPVVLDRGVYKRTTSIWGAVFIITGMTIGAGVLGLPYVVSQVGLKMGVFYIAILGVVVLITNLMIGEVAVRTKKPMHIPGFAGRYIGNWAKQLISVIILFGMSGTMLAYIIGSGRSLNAIFGFDSRLWSMVFLAVVSLIIFKGLETAKTVEKVLSILIILIIGGLSFYLLGASSSFGNWEYLNWGKVFLPYGVILFALHATPAISESHALLPGDPAKFRKAIIVGSLIPIALYILFCIAVVAVTGENTTEVATVGLGNELGRGVLLLGNIFAVLAMGTSGVAIGIAFKQTLMWDYSIKKHWASVIVISIPLVLFMIGFSAFVLILDFVGGFFYSTEAIMIVFIYWLAKRKGDLESSDYNLHHFWLLAIPVLLAFTIATVLSIIKLI